MSTFNYVFSQLFEIRTTMEQVVQNQIVTHAFRVIVEEQHAGTRSDDLAARHRFSVSLRQPGTAPNRGRVAFFEFFCQQELSGWRPPLGDLRSSARIRSKV